MSGKKDQKKDIRRLKPRGYFYRNESEDSNLARFVPRVSGRDMFLLASMLIAWILVGVFLVHHYLEKEKQSIYKQIEDITTPQKLISVPDLEETVDDSALFEELSLDDEEIVDDNQVVEYAQEDKPIMPESKSNDGLILSTPPKIDISHTFAGEPIDEPIEEPTE